MHEQESLFDILIKGQLSSAGWPNLNLINIIHPLY